MAYDYIDIAPSPIEEDCAQVGTPDFRKNAQVEMEAFKNQLERTFPEVEDVDAWFDIRWYHHDFGSYGSVTVKYNENSSDAFDFALLVESDIPLHWDDEAIAEIKSKLGNDYFAHKVY